MFNHLLIVPVRAEVQYTPPKIRICQSLELVGDDYVVHDLIEDAPLVPVELRAISVTPVERAKVGKISPSASNFLSPSLETMQAVAKTLQVLDDKFSYDAAMEKIMSARSSESAPIPETPKTE